MYQSVYVHPASMSKLRVFEIVKLLENGQFSAAFDLMNALTVSGDLFLHILVALSRCCYHTPEKCEAEYLEKFCNVICKSIKELDSKELNVYYQSVYHIIRFLCNKVGLNSHQNLFLTLFFLGKS